jgi:hypothetical protein
MSESASFLVHLGYTDTEVSDICQVLRNHDSNEIPFALLKSKIINLSKEKLIDACMALELANLGQLILYLSHDCNLEVPFLIKSFREYISMRESMVKCPHCGEDIQLNQLKIKLSFNFKKELF